MLNMTSIENHMDTARLLIIKMDEQSPTEPVEWNGHSHPPAMLLAYAKSELELAISQLERMRLTCFGLPSPTNLPGADSTEASAPAQERA